MKIHPKYQTIWQRFAAMLLDTLLFLPLVVLYELVAIKGYFPGLPGVLIIFLFPAAHFTYQILMHARYGQTLGKMAMKIMLVDVSGAKLRLRQALLRPAVDISLAMAHFVINAPSVWRGLIPSHERGLPYQLDSLVFFTWIFLVIISLFVSSKRRTVPDFIAGSVIIRTHPQSESPGTPEKKEKAPTGTIAGGILMGIAIIFSLIAAAGLLFFTIDLFNSNISRVNLLVAFFIWSVPSTFIAFMLFRKAVR